MSVDLEEMFQALRVDADALPLSPPQQVRRRGRRRRLIRGATTIGVICAVLIAASLINLPSQSWDPGVGGPGGPDFEGTPARLTVAIEAPINGLTYSPDGQLLATADNDGAVRLWDPQTGAPIKTLGPAGGATVVIQVAFSPDGTTLAASDAGGTIRLWDVATAQVIRSLAADRSGPVTDVAFSPDGQTLAAANQDGPVRLWPVTGGSPRLIRPPNIRTIQLALSPDGRSVVTGGQTVNQDSDDNTVAIWDSATLGSAHTFGSFTETILSVAFSPDGRTFATGGADGRTWLWHIDAATPTVELGTADASGRSMVADLAFSPDGRLLATVGRGQAGKLWDVATGGLTATLAGPAAGGQSVAFSPDGTTLAASCADGTLRLWDVP